MSLHDSCREDIKIPGIESIPHALGFEVNILKSSVERCSGVCRGAWPLHAHEARLDARESLEQHRICIALRLKEMLGMQPDVVLFVAASGLVVDDMGRCALGTRSVESQQVDLAFKEQSR